MRLEYLHDRLSFFSRCVLFLVGGGGRGWRGEVGWLVVLFTVFLIRSLCVPFLSGSMSLFHARERCLPAYTTGPTMQNVILLYLDDDLLCKRTRLASRFVKNATKTNK